jgi:hypothetical protein
MAILLLINPSPPPLLRPADVVFGSWILHSDRPIPIATAHGSFRDYLRSQVALRAPIAAMQSCNLYYITRRGAGEGGKPGERVEIVRRRNIENEDKFLPLLLAAGFQLIHLEDFDVEGKIRLFSSARMVVSPQSASLTFSVFMDSRSDVVEVFPDYDIMKHYCYMGLDNGHFWSRYTNVDTIGDPPDSISGNGGFNMIVRDPQDFVSFVLDRLDHPEKREHILHCKNVLEFPED